MATSSDSSAADEKMVNENSINFVSCGKIFRAIHYYNAHHCRAFRHN